MPTWPVSVTVPVEAVPPVTAVGETDTADRAAGVTVRVFDWLFPLKVAVMDTGVLAATPEVVRDQETFVAP